MIAFSSWGVFWIAIIIAAAFAIRVDRRAATIAIAIIVSMLAVYCGVYVATEWVVADLIAVTSNRLLMHLAAPALFLLALASQCWTRTKSM
jgi:succinate-acetate transporter protein